MAKLEGRAGLSLTVAMVLTEQEAGALDALAGYGVDGFLEVFYTKMGKAYLQPYEAGLRSLFDSVQNGPASVRGLLNRARKARQVFNGELTAIDPRDLERIAARGTADASPLQPEAPAGGKA